MYFKFPCNNCGKNLKVSDEHVGRKARCPYCHTAQTVPPVSEADESPSLDAFEGIEEQQVPVATQREGDEAGPPTEEAPQEVSESKSFDAVSGTDVSLVLSGLLGFVLAVVFYLLMLPAWLKKWEIGALFYDRGWVQYVVVFLAGWSLAILFLKSRKLAKQRDSMLFDLFPTDIADEITGANYEKFADNIRELPVDPRESFLINRVLRGLQHFKVRRNTQEVAGMLSSQSEIDAVSVESSYTSLNTFLWAIPILGFIGTVIGIGGSVGEFSNAMGGAQEIDQLKESLGGVTSELGVAFDTTLLALVTSVLLIFPIKAMQKAEEDLLNWVDEYCNENLLIRLKGGGETESGPAAEMSRELRKTIDTAMVEHHAELRTWTQRLEKIGSTLTEKAMQGWGDIHKNLQDEHGDQEKHFNDAIHAMAEKNKEIIEQINVASDKIAQLQADQKDHSMAEVAQTLHAYVTGMQESVTTLNETLTNLGEKQISIEVHKRGWFSRK